MLNLCLKPGRLYLLFQQLPFNCPKYQEFLYFSSPCFLGISPLDSRSLHHPINNIYLYDNTTHFSIKGLITHHIFVLHHDYLTETGKSALLWRPDPFSEVDSSRHVRELQPLMQPLVAMQVFPLMYCNTGYSIFILFCLYRLLYGPFFQPQSQFTGVEFLPPAILKAERTSGTESLICWLCPGQWSNSPVQHPAETQELPHTVPNPNICLPLG